ncbi:uncharacterized protein [Euphorbia lathyris]|uniref:uncharacterized protein n=1 Tax=Euphorbia lathyris TaxID=212925 RepID=UPI0033132A2D
MGNTKTPICVVIATLLIVGTLILNDQKVSASGLCATRIPSLITHSAKFVKKHGPKIPPSGDCCVAVKAVNRSCVCKYVTPKVESIISMDKVVYVARTCGLKVDSGTKCGSYTVPPVVKSS